MYKNQFFIAVVLYFIFASSVARAQTPILLPNIESELIFDGKLDETFWTTLSPLEMTMYQPVYKGDKTEKDEIYLVYDENYVYLAAWLYYKNTADIRSNSLYRDEYSGDDTFALILDTFNDNENALWFFTNPAGNRFDALISDDAEELNFDWNTYWDVKTSRISNGWSVELRVPFSSLGFQQKNGQVMMGAMVYRYLAKLNERYIYPDIPPEWEDGFRKPSQAQKVIFRGIESENPIYVTPYLLGGLESRPVLNESKTGYKKDRDWTHEPGADIKMNLTSNLTLDLTVNTDFAQVEADNEQVNLTRFPLFFPEKRQFFQERSSIFNFNFSRDGRLFHSRRIGLSATGEPIPIYGGVRLVGKVDNTDVGFINMQTASHGPLPSENFNMLRIKRKVFNRYSTIGAMFTSRIGNYEDDNYAYGLDGVVRVTGDEYLTLKWAQTVQGENPDLFKNSRLYFQWQRRRNNGLSYRLSYDRSGARFNPGVGFTLRNNFSLFEKLVEYKWITNRSPLFRDLWIDNFANIYLRNIDNQVESAVINPHAGANFKNGASYRIQANIRYEQLFRPFTLSEEENITVPAGEYWYPDVEMGYEAPDGWHFRPELFLEAGGFFDGRRFSTGIATVWNLSSHFEIGNEYEYNRVRFGGRSQTFDAHIARLRIRTALNTKLSLSSFAQYSSTADKTSINARFRYNMAQGDDLWIVYDNILNTDRRRTGLPGLPVSGYRAILVKFNYTFKF